MPVNYTQLATVCQIGDWFWRTAENVFITQYRILSPISSILSAFGHGIFLAIFYYQLKKDQAYMYQIFVVISQIFENVFALLYNTGLALYGLTGADRFGDPSYEWFSSYLPLVWYKAHLASPLLNVFATNGILLSVCMSADRLFALAKPITYKSIDHRRHQFCALITCLFLSFSTSIYDYFRYKVVQLPNDHFMMSINELTITTDWMNGMNQFRNSIRLIGLTVLIVCNFLTVYFYKKRMLKKIGVGGDQKKQKKQENKKKNERTLLLLSVYQSSFYAISGGYLVIFFMIFYVSTWLRTCGSFVVIPILDACQIIHILDFYVLFALSKSFRQMTLKTLPILNRFHAATMKSIIAPIGSGAPPLIRINS